MKLKSNQRLVLSSSGKGGIVEKSKARTEGRYFAGITIADYVCMCVMNLAKIYLPFYNLNLHTMEDEEQLN